MPLSLASALSSLDSPRYKAELYRMWLAGYHAGLEHPRILASIGAFGRSPAVEELRLPTVCVQGADDADSGCAALPNVPPFASRLAIEYGSATPTRKEKEGWIMSCSEQPTQATCD